MTGNLTIGTRGSQLALWQANWVRNSLIETHPQLVVELTVIKTKGDKILDTPLAKVGGKGLFVKEIESALLEGRVDLAVHSMKDMPSDIPQGLTIGPIPKRADARDAFIGRDKRRFEDLPEGAVIGTSSLRRGAQLKRRRPDVEIVPLRGNLDTRLAKLQTESLDGIILAAAGLQRLGLDSQITQYLETEIMLPAVGQGALCIEMRDGDKAVADLIMPLDHSPTHVAVMGERAFLHRLEGGCQVPIAGYGRITDSGYHLQGLVSDLNGRTVIADEIVCPPEEAQPAGRRLAERLLSRGANTILTQLNL